MQNQAIATNGTVATKIRFQEKLSYFWCNLGNIPVMTAIGGFLLFFYTDIVELNPVAVGTLFLVARFFDALIDPFVGYIIDHLPRTKWGRFRPWLVISSFLTALNFILLWLGPSMAVTNKLVIAYISYLLIGPLFASMDISLSSLLPVMTNDKQERNSLSMVKSLSYVTGIAIVNIAVVPVVSLFPTPQEGWYVVIIAIAIIIFALSMIGAAGVKERVTPISKERYTLKHMLKIMFKTKPVFISYLANFFFFASLMVKQGTCIYYLKYNLEKPELMGVMTICMLGGQIAGIIAGPILANRFEKKHVVSVALIIMGLGSLILYPIPYQNIPLILLTNVIYGIGMGGFMAVGYSMSADSIDYAEWKHKYRAEGAVAAIGAFFIKVSQALGGAIPAYFLAMSGYAANSAAQTPVTLGWILILMSVVPFIFAVISGLIMLAFPITNQVYFQMTKELAERHKQ